MQTRSHVRLSTSPTSPITPGAPDADALIDFVQITDLGSVPEPSSVVLLGSGMIGLFWLSRRKRADYAEGRLSQGSADDLPTR